MSGMAFDSSIRADLPWSHRKGGYKKRKRGTADGCHYKGWTLVDSRGYRWATKDGTNIRKRVCREQTEIGAALSAFRATVDEMEGWR